VRRFGVFVLLLTLVLAVEAHAAPLKVCALSFNSPDELRVFESRLPATDFQVVDLSPGLMVAGSPSPGQAGDGAAAGAVWNLCRDDLQCDVVVYSAEFGGRFFGKYGTSLGLQEMEEAACQARCQGFFHRPREVFLLACNTLATKDEDSRSPADYLQVLMDHGFDRASAERVVGIRYGPLGPSFRESLRRIFMGVPRLYGFSSVAPLGEHTAPMLDQYFRSKGDYRRYLEQAGRGTGVNTELAAAFKGTGLVQTSGLTGLEPAAADRDRVCALYDASKPVAARLEIIRGLMARTDVLAFLPSIQAFVDRHPREKLTDAEERLYEEIERSDIARNQVLGLVHDLDVSALQLELAHFAMHLDWVTPKEFHDLAVDGARRLLARSLTSETVDVMCEITKHLPLGHEFGSGDLSERLFQNAEGIRLIDCLSPADHRVDERLAACFDDPDPSLRVWAAYVLSRRLPLPDAVLVKLAGHLSDPAADVGERLRWVFKAEVRLSDEVRRALRASHPGFAEELPSKGDRRQGALRW
jgi:hypothetical protein